MKSKLIVMMLLSGVVLAGCTDWLDVRSKTAVDEEELFSREMGFKEALTGIYTQMAGSDLYGRSLTYGFIDRLAQRYRENNSALYDFPSWANESYVNSIWKRTYNVIANINNLLAWIEERPEVISTPGYLEIIKGEALGLRAFLHFDLLRLWGPVYKENPASPAIIYRTQFNRENKGLVPANEVLAYILQELDEAERLLANDPMIIEFPARETIDARDNFLKKRFKRMNLYAVKALKARVYLWAGDKTNAFKYAQEVINGKDATGKPYFALVTNNASDGIFSTEIIFSMSIADFSTQVTGDFGFNSQSYYIEGIAAFNELFNTAIDGTNDMRYRSGQGFDVTVNSACTRKYVQTGLYSEVVRNTLPLIRLSEMYYIMAECTHDINQAYGWIYDVCDARAMGDLPLFANEESMLDRLRIEYCKEFYAEGQYWYFLKRHNIKEFVSWMSHIEFDESRYRFSIPEDEKVLGTI